MERIENGQKTSCRTNRGRIHCTAEKRRNIFCHFPDRRKQHFFGRAQIGTLYSGNGSGGANVTGCGTILEECEKNGIIPEARLKEFYEESLAKEPISEADAFDWTKAGELVNSGIMYEIFGKYRAPLEEFEVPEDLAARAAEETDTALLVIGRNSGGEECDRHLDEDYYLTGSERKLVDHSLQSFWQGGCGPQCERTDRPVLDPGNTAVSKAFSFSVFPERREPPRLQGSFPEREILPERWPSLSQNIMRTILPRGISRGIKRIRTRSLPMRITVSRQKQTEAEDS